MNKLYSIILSLSVFVSLSVKAAEEKAMPVDPLSASSIANMVMGLGLVLLLIFLMAWVVKRMGGMQLSGSQKIKLLSGLSLGAREKVILIQVENKRLVLGVAQGQVSTLHVLDGEYENNDDADEKPDFKGKLLQAINKSVVKKKTEQ